MILTRAPLRISFMSGSSDIPTYFRQHGGRALSMTIDQYIYIALHPTPLVDKIAARYSISETVEHAAELQHTRIRAALQQAGIDHGLELASFGTLPSGLGLGSSSSFTCALLQALCQYQRAPCMAGDLAMRACALETETLREPIGWQDQYAAAFGGFNSYRFHPDGSVDVSRVPIDHEAFRTFTQHLLVVSTGISHRADAVLRSAQQELHRKTPHMVSLIDLFVGAVQRSDLQYAGALLMEYWNEKRKANGITNERIDTQFNTAISAGAYGGKLMGAGAGGCFLFLAPPDIHTCIVRALDPGVRHIPVRYAHGGTTVLYQYD